MASKLNRRELKRANRRKLKRAKCIGDGEARIGDDKVRNGDGETRIGDDEAGFVTVFVTVRLGLVTVRVRIGDSERVNRRRSESESMTVRSGFSFLAIWKYREQSFL